MTFYIQASNPKFIKGINYENERLSDAVESIFPLNTENAILIWNYISVPLSYKYDISYMLDDIIDLLGVLQSQNCGKKTIHWLPDTFRCDWEVCWNDGTIEIQAHWECTVGHLEKILNEHGTISLSVKDFESEWKEIFYVVIKGLKSCGYDKKTMGGMEDLLKQYERIRNSGILYRGEE